MNFSFYIAKRYAVSFSKTSAINSITIIASLGIIAGAAALFIVLSVFSGLKDLSLSFVKATDADYKIESKLGKSITLTPDQIDALHNLADVTNYSKAVEERVLFFYNDKEQVAYIKGVDSLFTKISNINNHLYAGNWLSAGSNEVVVGSEISRKLGLGLFDFANVLKAYSPKAGKGTIESIDDAFLITTLNPVGIYTISEDIDAKYVYCDLSLAQQLLQYKENQYSSIELNVKPNTNENELRKKLGLIFNDTVVVKNRIQQNDSLYKMLNTENIAVYLIFTLVIIIALFNLIGAIIMMIIDKKANLRTLHSLGTPINAIRKVFLYQGLLLTFFGGIVGLFIGIVLIALQEQYSFLMISETLPYPVTFKLINIIIVFVTILFLGYLASLLASARVNKNLLKLN
ncbi:ABC transporter permease [Flavobacterium sp.]|uniref:ABC transporter permease n=1 Tax=Flavobacterium sp. TaxID=239 RepID=UPI0035276258